MVARQFPVLHLELLLEVCGFESRLGRLLFFYFSLFFWSWSSYLLPILLLDSLDLSVFVQLRECMQVYWYHNNRVR